LNYMGQGALLMNDPSAIENPFYRMFPPTLLIPIVVLATAAAVIASQAVISGAFSMTKQAIQLGFLPRMEVVYTSAKEAGQIYLPRVNWLLLFAVCAAVIGFGSVSAIAAAYGIAVTVTMLIDTVLTYFVVRYGWGYSLGVCLFSTSFFMFIDAAFFSANMLKFVEGGWFPLAMGTLLFTLMVTWRRGREILFGHLKASAIDLKPFLKSLFAAPPARVEGTAVFLAGTLDSVPRAMLHNLAHNKVLHERVVFMTVVIKDIPWVPFGERIELEPLGRNCYQLKINFGFKNQPDVPRALRLCKSQGIEFNMMETSFFVSREKVTDFKKWMGK